MGKMMRKSRSKSGTRACTYTLVSVCVTDDTPVNAHLVGIGHQTVQSARGHRSVGHLGQVAAGPQAVFGHSHGVRRRRHGLQVVREVVGVVVRRNQVDMELAHGFIRV